METSVSINLSVDKLDPNKTNLSALTSGVKPTLVRSITTVSDVSNGAFCRICHQSDTASAVGRKSDMISPCKCSGTMANVHQHCLQRWASLSSSSLCDICGFDYKNVKKYPSICEWLKLLIKFKRKNRLESIVFWLMILGLLFVTTMTVIFILFNSSANFHMKLLLYIFLITGILFWMMYSIRFLYKSFSAWKQENAVIELVLDSRR